MPPSLRYVASLVVIATLCGAVSVTVLEVQDRAVTRSTAEALTGGHVDAGRALLRRDGCGACHQIRGVDGADGRVGPSLNGIAVRAELAGHLSNSPDHMIEWIRFPQRIDPGNGMPDLSVTEPDARDMAAYLYTLKSQL